MAERRSVLATLWTWVGHAGNVQFLFNLLGGFGLMSWAVSMMPSGWHAPQYWALAGLAFSAGMLSVALIGKGGRAIWAMLNPAIVRLEVHGGKDVTITVFVERGSDDFVAVAQMLGHDLKPFRAPYQMWWKTRHGHLDRPIHMSKDDFATLPVAKIDGHPLHFVFLGSPIAFPLKMNGYRMPEDFGPVLLRVTLRGRTKVYHVSDYALDWFANNEYLRVERLPPPDEMEAWLEDRFRDVNSRGYDDD